MKNGGAKSTKGCKVYTLHVREISFLREKNFVFIREKKNE